MELEEAIEYLEQFIGIKKEYKYKPIKVKTMINTRKAIKTVLQELKKVIEERDIYKEEHDKITKALNFKKGSLNPSVELVIGSLKKALQNTIPKKKIEDKIEEVQNKFAERTYYNGWGIIKDFKELLENNKSKEE